MGVVGAYKKKTKQKKPLPSTLMGNRGIAFHRMPCEAFLQAPPFGRGTGLLLWAGSLPGLCSPLFSLWDKGMMLPHLDTSHPIKHRPEVTSCVLVIPVYEWGDEN